MQKQNTVSVEEALSKASGMVNIPSVAVAVIATGLAYWTCSKWGFKDWLFLILPVVGSGAGLLCRSLLIPKWKVWAFENVRNVQELQKRATEAGLSRGNHEMYQSTEMWSPTDREKWNILQLKLEQPDLYAFTDDPSVPAEIVIRESTFKNGSHIVLVALLACMALVGLVFMNKDAQLEYFNILGGSIIMALGIYSGAKPFRRMRNKEAQIIVSNEGIKTATTPFYSWSEIEDERMWTYAGKVATYHLMYNYPGGDEKVVLNTLKVSPDFLQKALRVYRERYRHKTIRATSV